MDIDLVRELSSVRKELGLSQDAMRCRCYKIERPTCGPSVGLLFAFVAYLVCPLNFIVRLIVTALRAEGTFVHGLLQYGAIFFWWLALGIFRERLFDQWLYWTAAAMLGHILFSVASSAGNLEPRQAVPSQKEGVPVLHNPRNEPLPWYEKGLGVEYNCYLQVDKPGFYAFAVCDCGETRTCHPSKIYYGFDRVNLEINRSPYCRVTVFYMHYAAGLHRLRYESLSPKAPAFISLIAAPDPLSTLWGRGAGGAWGAQGRSFPGAGVAE